MSAPETRKSGPLSIIGSDVHDQSTWTTSPARVSQRPSRSSIVPPATTASIAARTSSASSACTYRSQKRTPPVSPAS